MIRKLVVGIALVVFLPVAGVSLDMAIAAERERPFRIGALTASWGPTPSILGLRDGLVALGYREYEDFELGVRFTQGDVKALPGAVRQLVEYGVDLIFASNSVAARAAQAGSSKIPIVFAGVGDPVGMALVQSFAAPGGNITGVTDRSLELGPKRLEIFRDMIPSLKRVLFLYDANSIHQATEARVYRDAARRLGIVLVEQSVQSEAEAKATLTQVHQDKIDGIMSISDLSLNIPGFIVEATNEHAVPTMFNYMFFVEQGGLASYGSDFYQSGRQAARLVDKILKGANPADIPVEVNSKIEFAINLMTAKTLGLTIPPEVLYRADRVIR